MFSKLIRGLLVIVVALTFVADLVFIYQMKGFMNTSNTQDKWLNSFRTSQEQVMDTKSGIEIFCCFWGPSEQVCKENFTVFFLLFLSSLYSGCALS